MKTFVLLYLAAAVSLSVFGPRIAASQGCGFDGNHYCWMVEELEWVVSNGKLDPYHAQRLLPALVVRGGLLAAGLALSRANAVRGFQVLNVLLLFVGGWLALAVAKRLKLTPGASWIWLLSLFVNFANLSHSFFYPVLTDVSAFFFGLLTLSLWLWRYRVALWLACLASWLVWPVAWAYGAILLVFPRQERGEGRLGFPSFVVPSRATLFGGALFFVALLLVHDMRFDPVESRQLGLLLGSDRLLPLSFLALGIFLYFALEPITACVMERLRRDLPSRWKGWAISAAAVAVSLVLFRAGIWWLAPRKNYVTALFQLQATAKLSTLYPLVFFPSHLVALGPVVLLLAFTYRRAVAALENFGLGALLSLLFTLVLALGCESRQQLFGLPWVCLAAALALDSVPLRRWTVPLYGVVSLLVARPGILSPNAVYRFHTREPFNWALMAPWIKPAELGAMWAGTFAVAMLLAWAFGFRFSLSRYFRSAEAQG
jgi:hypothetical protein